jgi:hypothetical protein
VSRLLGEARLESLEPRALFAVDPVTPDNPLWAVPRGGAVVDGELDDADWANAFEAVRTQATREDRAVSVRMMWNDSGLFLGVTSQDYNIYADGLGGGSGNRWEVETDDSAVFYFDPNNSRDFVLQDSDRGFGVNLGPQGGAVNGSGAVRRAKFVKGTGNPTSIPDVLPGGTLLEGIVYASSIDGTVNNAGDQDRGWTIEIFLPWGALNLSGTPVHGQTMGMNFEVIQDNDGGDRNLSDNRDGSNRFTLPHFIDDFVVGSHSSFLSTQPGVRGPVNYAEVMFIDARAGQAPTRIGDLVVDNLSPFGGRLNFTAPTGTNDGRGHVSGYEIRVSSGAITTDAQWLGATKVNNAFVPRLAGLSERLRIGGLSPNTVYNVAVRAIDGAGNYGPISNVVQVLTPAADPGDLGRIIPSPSGSTLVYEKDLTPFVVVGDHLGVSWGYTRQLFPGNVWDNSQSRMQNFYPPNLAEEGDVDDYFDLLQQTGVNTMRVYLELENAHSQGNPSLPDGTYWLESAPGNYNAQMRTFVENVLREASERNIKLIFSPFDSFSYDDAFNVEGPWGSGRGGPLTGVDTNGDAPSATGIDNFFQNSGTLEIAKNRMAEIIGWVNATPYGRTLIGWEPVSEWDSFEWTLNTEGNADPGRETEFRRRAVWIDELAQYIKEQDPSHLVMNSTITRDPRGPIAREVFYSRTWDVLTPHLYTNSNEEPINNPAVNKSILPAVENGYFTNYWLTQRIDNRPIINGEWGMTRANWPGGRPQYSAAFTQAQDEANFRTMMWSGIANGQAGMGLRIAADELASTAENPGGQNFFILTPGMRAFQRTFANFFSSNSLTLDWANFAMRTLAGRISAAAAGKTLLSWGVTDGSQGVAYVLHDTNRSSGTVTGGTLTLDGLKRNQIIDVEIWSTAAGTTSALSTLTALFSADGSLSIALPDFATDVAIKFRARPAGGFTQSMVSLPVDSFVVTFALGLDRQPYAMVYDSVGNQVGRQDVAQAANFRGRVVDMTPLRTSDGTTHLAVTDENSNLWLISGNVARGTWSSVNLTALIDAPGLTGDLTSYQPSWGATHLAGLDARGHAINYWIVPGTTPTWQFSDLTELFNGPLMSGNLTGYVTGWDGLNLAGINSDNQLIVYWWAPGLQDWQTINMTEAFDGPRLYGQLDAYVTPWGGLNVAGVNEQGDTYTYWWAPGLPNDPNRWRVDNISAVASTDEAPVAKFRPNVDVTVSTDGGINIFMICFSENLHVLRWTPADPVWRWNIPTFESGYTPGGDPNPKPVTYPIASGSAGQRLIATVRGGAGVEPIVFTYPLPGGPWDDIATGFVADR